MDVLKQPHQPAGSGHAWRGATTIWPTGQSVASIHQCLFGALFSAQLFPFTLSPFSFMPPECITPPYYRTKLKAELINLVETTALPSASTLQGPLGLLDIQKTSIVLPQWV